MDLPVVLLLGCGAAGPPRKPWQFVEEGETRLDCLQVSAGPLVVGLGGGGYNLMLIGKGGFVPAGERSSPASNAGPPVNVEAPAKRAARPPFPGRPAGSAGLPFAQGPTRAGPHHPGSGRDAAPEGLQAAPEELEAELAAGRRNRRTERQRARPDRTPFGVREQGGTEAAHLPGPAAEARRPRPRAPALGPGAPYPAGAGFLARGVEFREARAPRAPERSGAGGQGRPVPKGRRRAGSQRDGALPPCPRAFTCARASDRRTDSRSPRREEAPGLGPRAPLALPGAGLGEVTGGALAEPGLAWSPPSRGDRGLSSLLRLLKSSFPGESGAALGTPPPPIDEKMPPPARRRLLRAGAGASPGLHGLAPGSSARWSAKATPGKGTPPPPLRSRQPGHLHRVKQS
ncbi:collagen alpha-1(III) chain-like [Hippopotamus amphibius kiboko]|uniref:collagen alpha-1(III) chain-like n=1 Tax=Hippopotamus amphibius kiboko TaxID=575201 RepID=UPI002594693D|nr:collagen alpha-1(III) chain-like [Hippopotamus amphibius kiboko]